MKKRMRNCAKALAFAMVVTIFSSTNAGAATVNESKPMVLNSNYTTSLPVSSETFYKFVLKSKTKIMLDAVMMPVILKLSVRAEVFFMKEPKMSI